MMQDCVPFKCYCWWKALLLPCRSGCRLKKPANAQEMTQDIWPCVGFRKTEPIAKPSDWHDCWSGARQHGVNQRSGEDPENVTAGVCGNWRRQEWGRAVGNEGETSRAGDHGLTGVRVMGCWDKVQKNKRGLLTEFSFSPKPSPLGSEDLLLEVGVLLGVLDTPGFLFTTTTSQQAWSSFRVLFPALMTLLATITYTMDTYSAVCAVAMDKTMLFGPFAIFFDPTRWSSMFKKKKGTKHAPK